MSLDAWRKAQWLTEHRSSPEEVAHLLAIADRDLRASSMPGLDDDWRLAIAYNAALQCAVLALAASGYRPAREGHHYRTIQSLALTVGVSARDVVKLDAFRKKRNAGDYEQAGLISEKEADEMVAMAKALRRRVETWMRTNHPELLTQ